MKERNMKNIESSKHKIPDKRYFRIGEVSSITDVEAYVLRFWQTEFKGIRPRRTSSDQRLYRRSDIELILKIKSLLYEKKFTIRGAKQYLKDNEKKEQPPIELLDAICAELQHIRDILN
jgi:DNA-binding transcriptional MerR regulator